MGGKAVAGQSVQPLYQRQQLLGGKSQQQHRAAGGSQEGKGRLILFQGESKYT